MNDLKRKALLAWGYLRAFAVRHWKEFRKHPRYFQLKAAIGVVYVLLIVTTVVVVVPRTPSNRLSAYVLAARADFVAGSYILVRNDSSKEWEQVILTLNGTHRYAAPPMKPGDRVRVELKAFVSPTSGTLTESQVRELELSTSRGTERYLVNFLVN
jgi:hypothetical protein